MFDNNASLRIHHAKLSVNDASLSVNAALAQMSFSSTKQGAADELHSPSNVVPSSIFKTEKTSLCPLLVTLSSQWP